MGPEDQPESHADKVSVEAVWSWVPAFDSRLPKFVLYRELSSGKHSAGGQCLRCKDSLKHSLNNCSVSVTDGEEQAIIYEFNSQDAKIFKTEKKMRY